MSIHVDIHKKYGDFSLDVCFHSQSRRIGVLGASGCGKSLTLKSIAGIETPDTGLITLDERTLFDADHKINPKPQKRKVGYLFQNYALFPNMTVRQNIGAGIRKGKKEKAGIIESMMDKFQLQGLGDHLPMELSGGQQQRVALARIMAYEPDVILLDEPFSALDVYLKERLQHELLDMLEDYPGTVIMVSHSRDEIYRFSEELLIIHQGQIVTYGKTRDIFKDPHYKEAAKITGCKNIVDVTRMDAHTLLVNDWNLTLHFRKEIPEEVTSIGIRAHDFIPIWDHSEDNTMAVSQYRVDELPFERKYYIRSQEAREDVCWFVQRDLWKLIEKDGMPDYLKIPEEKVLLLRG